MRVQVVGAAAAGGPGFALSTFLFDGVLAVDAGALGWCDCADRLAAVRHVLLTHSHLDHIAGLPILLDTVYGLAPHPPTVHAPEPTLKALRDHLFNDHLVPDFVRLSESLPPFLKLDVVEPGRPVRIDRYEVTPVAVEHTVPTVAYLVDDGSAAVAVVTDTAPVPAAFDQLARAARLKAVFLEASFPNDRAELAALTRHLTSDLFLAAARRFPVPVYAVHVKPRFFEVVSAEIEAGGVPNAHVAVPGMVLEV